MEAAIESVRQGDTVSMRLEASTSEWQGQLVTHALTHAKLRNNVFVFPSSDKSFCPFQFLTQFAVEIEYWASGTYMALWNVILPALNIVGIMICAISIALIVTKPNESKSISSRCCFHSFFNRSFQRVREVRHSSIPLMVHVLELLAFLMRLAYCAEGAMFSKPQKTGTGLTLQQGSVPIEVVVSLMATILFIRWNAFKIKKVRRRTQWIKFWIWMVVGIPGITGILFARGLFQTHVAIYVLVVCIIVFQFVSVFLFLRFGLALIRELGPGKQKHSQNLSQPDWKVRWYRRAVRWILMSLLMKLVALCGALAVLDWAFWLTPHGYSTCHFLILFGATGQALTQVIAFLPSTRRTENLVVSVAGVASTPYTTPTPEIPHQELRTPDVTPTFERKSLGSSSPSLSPFLVERQESIKRKKDKASKSRQDLKRRASEVLERKEELGFATEEEISALCAKPIDDPFDPEAPPDFHVNKHHFLQQRQHNGDENDDSSEVYSQEHDEVRLEPIALPPSTVPDNGSML
jgi:hypothetical protein